MALTRKELMALTKNIYKGAARHADDFPSETTELIPTMYEEQKEYFSKHGAMRGPVVKGTAGRVYKSLIDWKTGNPMSLSEKAFQALPVKDFAEDATKPDEGLTKTYIKMMDAQDGDDWNKALDILYPEGEKDE